MGGRLPRALVAALICTAAALVACSDDGKDPGATGSDSGSESGSGSPSPVDDLILPEGTDVTPGGSELAVGDTATVAYEVRQGVVAVLDITVTRLEKTSFAESFVGWDIDAETQTKKPYFVRATVTNTGETDLAGRPVPLYIVDGTNTLVEATSFESTFEPCQPGVLPKAFPTGSTKDVCLVFLAPNKGELTAVSFRPTQEYDPITWTGELQKPKPPKPDKGKGNKQKG
jgi:hypothetical protein